MHSLKSLEGTLGQSYEQIRRRVNKLSDSFEGVAETGKRNKTLVTDNGLTLLWRLKELEEQGYSLEAGMKVIEEELSKNQQQVEQDGATLEDSGLNQAVDILGEEIEFLREQLRAKDHQLQQKTEHIQRLLPAQRQSESPKSAKTFWDHVKEWLTSPVA
ncbi:MAG: hypothetical protein ACLFN4_01185 [Candidatus Acetothermia bacterium]